MSIDEIIESYEMRACLEEKMGDTSNAEEHKQVAEWLRELKRWREFGRKNAQFINDCLLQNHIDKLFSSEIKNDADILRIVNEALTLRTTNEFCKSFNEQFEDNVCKDCYYNDGDAHAECVICDKAESEEV